MTSKNNLPFFPNTLKNHRQKNRSFMKTLQSAYCFEMTQQYRRARYACAQVIPNVAWTGLNLRLLANKKEKQ